MAMRSGDPTPEPGSHTDGAYQHNISLLTLAGAVIVLSAEALLKKIGIKRRVE
jgi:hypothetical protein